MPGIYRAPEIVLGMDWDSKVDIWAVGVMVSAICAAEEVVTIYPTKIGPCLELVYENTTPPSPNQDVSFSQCLQLRFELISVNLDMGPP